MNYLIQQSTTFANWHRSLRDLKARISIARRLDRIAMGNLGDVKSLGQGISELRVDIGAGYRVYFTMRSGIIIVLLAGGDKSTQEADIKRARSLAKEV